MGRTKSNGSEINIEDIDLTASNEMIPVEIKSKDIDLSNKTKVQKVNVDREAVPSCLSNTKIIVRKIMKTKNGITDKKHVMYGGMLENSKKTFCVPMLSSGSYVNVLTNDEKAFLEDFMGLDHNALSVYKKYDNFWDDTNPNGCGSVTLGKRDTILDLSNPNDFIRYKVLLANKDFICPSMEDLDNRPKQSYEYVIIHEGVETKRAKDSMSLTMKCYKEFGKIEENKKVLKFLVESLTAKAYGENTDIEVYQTKLNELIQTNAKKVYEAMRDPMLNTKILLKDSVANGSVAIKGDYYYLRDTNQPLCDLNQEPTLAVAAAYLNSPKHQDILFLLQAKQGK
jgi:hypothetical protein